MIPVHQAEYLTTTRLSIGYKQKSREVCVAETPELSVLPGDFICLLGPNGAGKSTLIRTLAGMQAPLHGSIRLKNQVYDHITPRERARMISVVLTEPLSMSMMDAYSLVALGRHPYTRWLGGLKQADKERIEWSFQAVNARGLEARQIAELSDGERQKILIARALAQETPLILLDEPTAFLDLPRRIELITTLRNLAHQERIGVLLSSHDLDLALRFADCLWVFTNEGTLVKGHPEELALNGEIAHAFASGQVEWNIERGGFHAQTLSHLKAHITGSGIHAQWTQRALERFGFDVTNESERCALKILLSETTQYTEWLVEHNGSKYRYSSIGHFIEWLRSQDWSTSSENS